MRFKIIFHVLSFIMLLINNTHSHSQINIPSKGFFLPSWYPFGQQIEAAGGALELLYELKEFQKITDRDKQWINVVSNNLRSIITQETFNSKSMQEINQIIIPQLKTQLHKERTQVSGYIFIRSALGLKEEIERTFNPGITTPLINLIDQQIKDVINQYNPHKNVTATVRIKNDMSEEEIKIRTLRLNKMVPVQQQIIDTQINKESALKIGIVMSGGGYRAMTLTAGYLKGLEKIGVLNSSLYVTGLSGSTWFIAPWISENLTIEDMRSTLKESIRSNNFNILGLTKFSPKEIESLLFNIIWPKKMFNQPLTSIDFFGAILAKASFFKLGNPFNPRLSYQYKSIHDGSKPFPLYTAISIQKESENNTTRYFYHWYEFNPIEMSNLDLGYSIPIWSAGRLFDNGKSRDFAPEQTLGYFMGVWGSAYSVNIKDVKTTMTRAYQEFEEQTNIKNRIAKFTFELNLIVISILEKLFGGARISPAQIFNPWKGIATEPKNAWIKNKQTITLVDGGFESNIAGAPLFFKNRNLDLIIVCDSSKSIGQLSKGIPLELSKLFDYLKKLGLHYRQDNIYLEKKERIKVYTTPQANKPVIIYLDFQKDTDLMNKMIANNHPLALSIKNNNLLQFDYTKTDYTGTFNFDYTVENFDQLSGLGEFVIRSNQEAIFQVMKKIYKEKQPKAISE